jgi:hypothetical protein
MRRLLLVSGCVAALAAPAGSGAAGGPVPALQGGSGVSVPGGATAYVAVGVGRRTLVEQVLRPAGAIGRTLTICTSSATCARTGRATRSARTTSPTTASSARRWSISARRARRCRAFR